MDWSPTLEDREGPVYRHIVDALAADITNGRLRRGQQLPTHRASRKRLASTSRPSRERTPKRGVVGLPKRVSD